MAKSLFFYPYNANSQSVIELSRAAGGRRISRTRSTFRASPRNCIVNWGSSEVPSPFRVYAGEPHPRFGRTEVHIPYLNPAIAVRELSNKKRFFEYVRRFNSAFRDEPTYLREQHGESIGILNAPAIFTTIDEVRTWFLHPDNHNRLVLARTILNGHSGAGIVILDRVSAQTFAQPCNLFVEYIKKQDEYRLHFFDEKQRPNDAPTWHVTDDLIFFKQKKGLLRERAHDPNFQIRNVDGGWVFINQEGQLEVPDVVLQQAKSFLALNRYVFSNRLNFGALDILHNVRYNKAYVIEVNTAPGLTGRTLEAYADKFRTWAANL